VEAVGGEVPVDQHQHVPIYQHCSVCTKLKGQSHTKAR
jgi:hypothetical protein